jgi:hypothetical protein
MGGISRTLAARFAQCREKSFAFENEWVFTLHGAQ